MQSISTIGLVSNNSQLLSVGGTLDSVSWWAPLFQKPNGIAPAAFGETVHCRAGAVMVADNFVSQELKTMHEEWSASQKERAASRIAGTAPANIVGPTTEAPEENELHDQLRQFADQLKGLFDGADKGISAHPTQSVVGAMLVGILIGRLLGKR